MRTCVRIQYDGMRYGDWLLWAMHLSAGFSTPLLFGHNRILAADAAAHNSHAYAVCLICVILCKNPPREPQHKFSDDDGICVCVCIEGKALGIFSKTFRYK